MIEEQQRDPFLHGLGKWIILFHGLTIATIVFCVAMDTYEVASTGKPPRGRSLLLMGEIYRVFTCGTPILGKSMASVLIRGYLVNALWIIANIFVIRGVLSMQRYENYRAAWWTTILITIPCVGFCFNGAGLICGPFIMAHLLKPQVREKFSQRAKGRPDG